MSGSSIVNSKTSLIVGARETDGKDHVLKRKDTSVEGAWPGK